MPKLLTTQDYTDAAERLGVSVAAICAVAEVESKGGGFLPDGRPVILFERHKFYAFTNGKYSGQYPDISDRLPGGYGDAGAHQWERFSKAFRLDPQAAMKATSWGKFQIMGFNYATAGFKSVDEFVDAMKMSEREHLMAFVRFVEANDLARLIKVGNWQAFARAYNGPDYKQNAYDRKLDAAYKKFANLTPAQTEDTGASGAGDVSTFSLLPQILSELQAIRVLLTEKL